MKELKKYKNVIGIVLAMITTIGITINIDINNKVWFSVGDGNEIIYVILFILYAMLIGKALKIEDKKASIYSILVAILLAGFQIVGTSILQYKNLDGIFEDKITFLKAFLNFIAFTITFYSMTKIAYTKILPTLKKGEEKEKKYFTNNKRSFFLVMAVIFIAYIPYLLNEFPGIISGDSCHQMMIGLGYVEPISNHHPVFHIFVISIAMNIGKWLGSYEVGIAIYSIFQMLFTATIFSTVIYYMARKKVNIWIRLLCVAIFALYPPFAAYSVTMWKDVPFGLVMVLYTICLIELVTNKKEFMTSIKKNLLFVFVMLSVFLFRNNGIYVLILTMPFMIIISKDYRKRMVLICGIIILCYGIWKGPIFSILHISDSKVAEALSIPLQQMARVTKYEGDRLTQEEKDEIYKYLSIDYLAEVYNPEISDSVKLAFNDQNFEKDKIGFVKIWLKLCMKYPKTCLESFLCNSYGYWYPEGRGVVVSHDFVNYEYYSLMYHKELAEKVKDVKFEKQPILKISFIDEISYGIDNRSIPVISMLFSIGLFFWLLVMVIGYVIKEKQYRLLVVYVPTIVLWLTCLASPVACEYRYIYGLFTCFPILTVGVISLINQKNEESEE